MNPLDLRWQMVRDRWPLRVKNSSGSVIPPYSFVLVSSETASNNEMLYTVTKPNAASTDFNRSKYLVTGPFAIGAGATDEGLATNLTQPNYISTDAAATIGQIWGPKHNQFTAARYYYGYEILGGATTFNGINVAVAKWIGVDTVLGKADGTIGASYSGTVSIWNGAGGSESDTGMDISTVYNRGAEVASGAWVFVGWNGESPYIVTGAAGTSGSSLYRGTTDGAVSKGGTVTVSRYTDGTTSDSGTNDTGVLSELGAVAAGAVVYYMESGANKYIIAVEKTSVAVMTDIRINTGTTHIESNDATVQVEVSTAAAWGNQIALTDQNVLTGIQIKSGDTQIEALRYTIKTLGSTATSNSDQIALTTKSVITDMRIKSGNAQIEAQALDALILKAGTAAWSDKISLTACT